MSPKGAFKPEVIPTVASSYAAAAPIPATSNYPFVIAPPTVPYYSSSSNNNNNSYSNSHPPAPPAMPWKSGPSYGSSSSGHGHGNQFASNSSAAPYNRYNSQTSTSSSSGYAPYGQMGGRADSFGSFSNLHRQDWSAMNLIPFEKNFYREHPAVKERSESQIQAYRQQHAMSVFGSSIPKPVQSFDEGCFPEYISKMLSGQGFASPTAIQAQVQYIIYA